MKLKHLLQMLHSAPTQNAATSAGLAVRTQLRAGKLADSQGSSQYEFNGKGGTPNGTVDVKWDFS